MRLLGQHPEIVAYRPFEFEPRVSTYWMHILRTLSEPVSYLQPIAGFSKREDYWWIGNDSTLEVAKFIDSEVQQWLGQNNIETLLAFCQNRIEAFYDHVAKIQNQIAPVYFAEKYLPDHFVLSAIWELYPQAHEVFLVRDFRDVVCSILAFNAQRGYAAFGRELATNDEQYVRQLRGSAVRLLKSWKRRSHKAHLLRYEDLILRPIETLTSLLEYLNLEPTPLVVERMIQRASEETSGMRQHRTSPDPEKSIGRWRRDLDPSLQAVCQEAFGDVLQEFGYTE
jgi:hypothetical protein